MSALGKTCVVNCVVVGLMLRIFTYHDCRYNRFYTFFSQHLLSFRINLKQRLLQLVKWSGEEMNGRMGVFRPSSASADRKR